ncbi:PPPDE putative peptidase domain-containing protein [Baffinella frigidus]|nr:PPPDE putative peptidase domain-containing protein [Cryptophyta sp. CCMP2293]
MGFGICHSGIEVYGREIAFGYSDDGSTGVFEVPSRCAGGVMPRINFKEGVVMGHIHRSRYEVDHLLARLADDFPGDSYDLVRRNCNHFANELCVALVAKKIPSYINRPANFGRVALNLISVPALAIGKIVDGIKKTNRKEV